LEHLQRCSVCGPAKYIFTCKFSYLLFCNPTHKTETGTANRWETTNNKPPGPIIMMGQSETLISSQIITLLLFSAGGLVPATTKCIIMLSQTIFLTQTGMFDFSSSNFYSSGSHTQHRWRCKYLVYMYAYTLTDQSLHTHSSTQLPTFLIMVRWQVTIPNITSNIWMMNIMLV